MSAILVGRDAATSTWRRVLPALLLVLVGLILAYRETAQAMVGIWLRSESFAHAFAVLPIAAWLVWRKRDALLAHEPMPTPWLLLPMSAMTLLWLVGDLATVNAAMQLALVALLVLAVPAFIGVPAARNVIFPLGFLFFAVPVGDFLVPQLMLWTADFTVSALRLTGIPVYREGQQLVIPSGTWSVVEACSGVRYLMASVMVGSLFAYLNYRSLPRRLAFVGVAIVVPIVANWVRAYLIVLLGHLTNNKLAAGADHLIYGWVFFGVVIALMFAIGARWSDAPAPSSKQSAPVSGASDALPRSPWAVAFGVAVIAMILPPLVARAIERRDSSAPPTLAPLAHLAHGWREDERPFTDWQPAFKGPSVVLNRTYRSDRFGEVGLYVGYYRSQDYGRKMIASDNVLVPSSESDWVHVASAPRTIDIAGEAVVFTASRLRGSVFPGTYTDRRLAIWQIYWVDDTLTSSDARAKLLTALQRLRGRGDDGAVVIAYAPEGEGERAGDAAIEDFLRANLAALAAQLRSTRDGS